MNVLYDPDNFSYKGLLQSFIIKMRHINELAQGVIQAHYGHGSLIE